jgi:hypothetical protein
MSEFLGHALGQVGGAVGDDRDVVAAGGAARLRAHVVGLGRLDAAEARGQVEQRLRLGHVRVQADARVRTGDHHAGGAQVRHRRAQPGAVEAFAQQQALAAPAVRGILVEQLLVRLRRLQLASESACRFSLAARPPSMNSWMPSSRSTKPCAPASTTPGLLQHRQCSGVSASACRARCTAGANQALAELRLGCCSSASAKAWIDAEDRAFARLGHRPARRARAGLHRLGELEGLQHRPLAEVLGHAGEELRQDRPELPRAPSMASSPTRRISSPAPAARWLRAPASTLPRVKARLLPVSPSGTGKTLILLRTSRSETTSRAPEISARRNAGPRISRRDRSRAMASHRPSVGHMHLGLRPYRLRVQPFAPVRHQTG